VLLGIDELVCMIVIAAVSALLEVAGGYLTALRADFIQGAVMLFGVFALIIAVFNCDSVGGLSEGFKNIVAETEKLNLDTSAHIGLWATVLMTSFGTWGLPQMIHKYYGIKDKAEVVRGTVISTLFCLVIAGGGYFIGSLSRLFPEAFADGVYDNIIPNVLEAANVPTILLGIILVLLISASGIFPYPSKISSAYSLKSSTSETGK
jgi:SSS family solute:Na+ symporter/sodium/proline symporter